MSATTFSSPVLRAAEALLAQVEPALIRDPAGVIWVSLDFMALLRATAARPDESEALADHALSVLREAAGPGATLLVSAFSFTFPQTGRFDAATTPVQTGAFGGLLLRRYPEARTLNPFYSFLAFGARAEEVLANRSPHSTGPDSIFEWVIDQGTDLVTLGHHYIKSLSSVHHAEELAGVDYRYRKSFPGRVTGQGETIDGTYTFFVRDLDTCGHSSITRAGDAHLRAQGLVDTWLVGTGRRRMLAHRLNLAAAHAILVDDLRRDAPRLVDYLGPGREDRPVVTGPMANTLYLEELATFRDANAPSDQETQAS
ncbi:AAC(3) family N-acetyltransferase [Roseospira marina]|uniref:Aminoglycoside N(3)-acetyltransferase n=1 Tax=Roseospira marina TaxID=140057 RepID=A0A5M6IAC2_9PROT|nr:AAC(3) family N-acetyltransferase [Roseospira marina]KAA5605201.1 AAC(3) family N-acetyltransferase [Roseospira marina]MBB4314654.1 aminoglycoside N3'-acetyltransferase [Roseospira marina]MBB5087643.1 aminoglycoside N3'-acetyltransferase [Roseospira marina]